MKVTTMRRLRASLTAMILGSAALTPLQASSQEITLRSNGGGGFEITGRLVSFQDNIYTMDTNMGLVNIDGDRASCISGDCPEIVQASVQDGPIVWSVSLWGKRRAFTEHVEKLAELVEAKTDGEFKLELYYGDLSPSRENLDGIAEGAFEMAQFCAGYHPDKNPSITVLELPFLGVASMEQELSLSQAVYEHPAVAEDMARWNATLLMPTPQPQYNIAGVGTPPTSLSSFQSMTVRATGGTGVAIQALGASSISLPAPEVKDALARGEINAVAFAPHAHMSFETIDSAVWWTTNLNPGTANCPVVVNTQALNALPSASRVALLSSVDEALDHFIANYKGSTMAAWDAALRDRGIIEISISEDILTAINEEVAEPAANDWIVRNAALGLPAQELYDVVKGIAGTSR